MRVFALFVSLAASAALAEPEELELDWVAPLGCPSAESIEAEVDKLVSSRERSHAHLRVAISVEHAGDRWVAHLESEGAEGSGERDYEADDCSQLASATAVIIAVALAPQLPAPVQPPRDWFWSLQAQAGVELGALPQPTAGFGLDAAYFRRNLGVRLRISTTLPERALGAPLPEAGATFAIPFAARLAGCWEPLSQPLVADLCLGADARIFQGSGTGMPRNLSSLAVSIGPAAALGLGLRLGLRWVLRLDAAAAVPIARPVFWVAGYGALFRPSPVWGDVRLGLELRL